MLQMKPAGSQPRIAAGRGGLCNPPVLTPTRHKAHKYPSKGSELPVFLFL